MTAVFPFSDDVGHNESAFETCLAGALRTVASLEFSNFLGEAQPTRELLMALAEEIERHAQELAVVAGGCGTECAEQGKAWFEELTGVRDDPLQAAYYSLHAAAYLGLAGGASTARVLSGVGWALRGLSEREGRLTN
jgi:hypothetical protein